MKRREHVESIKWLFGESKNKNEMTFWKQTKLLLLFDDFLTLNVF